jgi:hypothetical protein
MQAAAELSGYAGKFRCFGEKSLKTVRKSDVLKEK